GGSRLQALVHPYITALIQLDASTLEPDPGGVGRAPHRDQNVGAIHLLFSGGRAHDEADFLPGSPLYTSSLSSHQYVDPFSNQEALDRAGPATILRAQELRGLLDDGPPPTEPPVCLRQFETDIASPEHDEVRRQVVEIQCLDVRERSGRLKAGNT